MRVFSIFAGALALLAAASDVGAQFPAEVRGEVVDLFSGRPVAGAAVRATGADRAAVADASGSFWLRGIGPGSLTLAVQAAGYAPLLRELAVSNGDVTIVRLQLVPEPLQLDGIEVRADGTIPDLGGHSLTGLELRSLPARTVGDLAAYLPGLQIVSRDRGGAQVPTLRGSSSDAVLVLLDGVPINDPISGEADLSSLSATSVSALRVLPGGQSARYGARAEGGVILIETAGDGQRSRELSAAAGSLGERTLDTTLDRGLGSGLLSLSGGIRRLDGRFRFERPDAVGGGTAVRENAGLDAEHAGVTWTRQEAATTVRLVGAGERLERGLPGRSFAPSPSARQGLLRGRLSAALDRDAGPRSVSLRGWAVVQRIEHEDAAPPLGDPYDDRTSLAEGGAEVQGSVALGTSTRVDTGLGLRQVRVRSTQLAATADALRRTDAGGWVTASRAGPFGMMAAGSLRLDRAEPRSGWFLSHDVGLSWAHHSVTARLGHRSSFSPPTLGDQYFREGVGVETNPNLAAERVPSEWIATLTWRGTVTGSVVTLGAEAYQGDIRGMIVWLPDFRFVWSPRNIDVHRGGVELTGRLTSPARGLDVRGHFSWNRTTYDRPGLRDVQVVYRPRFSGGSTLSWSHGRWRIVTTTAFVGARYPVPNRVNELPSFWSTSVAVTRNWTVVSRPLDVSLELERVFDHKDALIFAFPDPGRTARIVLRWGH